MELEIPDGFKFDRIEGNKIILKDEFEYRKLDSFDKCHAKLKGEFWILHNRSVPTCYKDAIIPFIELLTCYKAYVGEWTQKDDESCYIVAIDREQEFFVANGQYVQGKIFKFPTYDMAQAFLDNFKYQLMQIRCLL
jgi:hypothetical protein